MKIILKNIDEIIPYETNPKVHPQEQINLIANSIEKFKFDQPLVIDENNIIIKGHGRLLAAQLLKLEKVPVIIRTDMTEAEKKASRIADNKSNESDWDFPLLELELEKLKEMDFDFDFGFDDDLFPTEEKEGLTDDDYIPEEVEPICKTGDLWKLGEHRVLCGDATKKEDVERLMGGCFINLLVTSPPYWVGKDYEYQKSEKEIDEFISNCIDAFLPYINIDYSRILINSGTGMATRIGEKNSRIILLLDKWINKFYKNEWYLRHIRHWIKGGGNSGSPISAKADFVFSGIEYLMTFYNINGKSRGQNKISESWAQQSDWTGILGDKQENKAGFPVEIPKRFIELYSLKSESILDNFMGNGTTLIACEKTNRKCYGMEIDEHYCDVIINRYEQFTGKKAELIK